jgi:hypothetical protein
MWFDARDLTLLLEAVGAWIVLDPGTPEETKDIQHLRERFRHELAVLEGEPSELKLRST